MKNLLLDLLPELLGAILAFNEVSHMSRELWLCGSKFLHTKLSRCVHTVALRDHRTTVLGRIPSYLVNLRSLRELEIDIKGQDIYHLEEARYTIRGLSDTLEKLNLGFSNWENVLLFYPAPTSSPDSAPHVYGPHDFRRFNRLTTLSLPTVAPHNDRWFETMLPATVTDLKACVRPIEGTAINIPASVTRLTCLLNNTAPVKAPPTVTHLTYVFRRSWDMERYSEDTLRGLAGPNVTRLEKMLLENAFRFWHTAGLLRDLLEPIRISPFYLDIEAPLRASQLSMLTAISCGQSILTSRTLASLPKTLTMLKALVDGTDVQEQDWPTHLSILRLADRSKVLPPLPQHYPPSLAHFIIEHAVVKEPIVPMALINRLPKRLISFTSQSLMLSKEPIEFPPSLKTLIISQFTIAEYERGKEAGQAAEESGFDDFLFSAPSDQSFFTPKLLKVTRCFPFHKLPHSLQQLEMEGGKMPFSRVARLPPCLLKLVIAFEKDADYDATDPKLRARVQYLRRQGIYSGAFMPTAPQREDMAMLDLLPRTLTDLTILDGDEPDGWGGLPQGLKHLKIELRETLDPKILLQIPMLKLNSLKLITVQFIRDEHMAMLGQNLRSLQIGTLTDAWDVTTEACIRHMPPQVVNVPDNLPTQVREELSLELGRRRELLLQGLITSPPR